MSGGGGLVYPVSEEEHARLRARLGDLLYAKRLQPETDKIAKRLRQGEGVFKLERVLPVYLFLRASLRVAGVRKKWRTHFLDVRVVEQEWLLPCLPVAFEGFRLLQLTDLHCDLDTDLTAVVEKRVRATPHDAAVVTGDYRDGLAGDASICLREMARIAAALAPERWGVLGNHDFLEMVPALERLGLPILLNEAVAIRRGEAALWIAGIDDPHFYQTHDLPGVRARIPSDACTVLLSHSPETYRESEAVGFDLQLSGHTHGGQICLPGGHHIVVPCLVPRRFVNGRWAHGRLQGYTSPGTGGCGVAARWNCPPEITVHILRRGAARTHPKTQRHE